MNINIDLANSSIELDQSDYDTMWDCITQDSDSFIYMASNFLEGLDLEYYKEDLKPLYEKLKSYYENN